MCVWWVILIKRINSGRNYGKVERIFYSTSGKSTLVLGWNAWKEVEIIMKRWWLMKGSFFFFFLRLRMMVLLFFFSKLTLDCPFLTPRSTSPWAACWTISTGTRCSSSVQGSWSTSPWMSTDTASTPGGSSATWTWILRCDGYVSMDTSLRMCMGLSPAKENTLLRTPLSEWVKVLEKP